MEKCFSLIYIIEKIKMAESLTCPNIKPTVINCSLLKNCLLKQAPIGEKGRILAEEGIDFKCVSVVRLDFMNIIEIECLWMMKNLRRISLTHNKIRNIKNLDELANLKELDLSFNEIEEISELENLTCLETLMLNNNKIQNIKNLDTLVRLTVFSISENAISDYKQAIYLRRFKHLKSLSFKGNPCCKYKECNTYLKAILPNLVYIDYKLVSAKEKLSSVAEFRSIVEQLSNDDLKNDAIENEYQTLNKISEYHRRAFVDEWTDKKLFENMFQSDHDGVILLNAGGELKCAYDRYSSSFSLLVENNVKLNLSHHHMRENEIDTFKSVISKARDTSMDKNRSFMDSYYKEKSIHFKSDVGEFDKTNTSFPATKIDSNLMNNLTENLWKNLMNEEVTLFEQCEKTRKLFVKNLKNLVNTAVDDMKIFFYNLQCLEDKWVEEEKSFYEKLIDHNITVSKPDIEYLLTDPESIMYIIALSKENRGKFIEVKIKKFNQCINQWLENLIQEINSEEVIRHRARVIDIYTFVQKERKE